ncbi:tubulin-like doman-containing protein [Frankia sp. CiP3]|uniref:tubulin-like doman-containing protein n=1 Tax=Frankia sp. CiP3 TaxID=2880971 RepID=UPI001EF63FD3|nr:tubulin-like doman-containing protein [Frankia sp. CiP3]
MNIYQPMLFVGLGGTGCLVGTDLERRLRDELCGPDGRDLIDRVPGTNYLPYQLPSCLQFVYADLNQSELTRLRQRVVPAEEHKEAAGPTLHLVHDLIPDLDTFPDVARSLRTNANDYVREWLPPPTGEPKVSPLVRGAGQLPTVGRAALFETFRNGLSPARKPLADATGEISNSAAELAALGGRLGQTCDVFVAFSVAGGTGAGIFYDYLHLIGDVFQRTRFRAQIYPLVLMPSAFEDGVGGGRRAKLNAGRALLDLYRLIDDQNGRASGTELTVRGTTGTLGVRYPDRDTPVSLLPSTIQTGFLFSKSDGVDRDDLHRSVVSLILSLVGTGTEHDDGGTVADRIYQSFADDFINRGVERQVAAASGIGRRGVSTSLVASMTIPVDGLADVVASRLLARAYEDLATLRTGAGEDNTAMIRQFAAAANIGAIVSRQPLPFGEPSPARGSAAILSALRTRVQTMEDNLVALQAQVRRTVPELAMTYDPAAGLEDLLTDVDLFRVRRVVDGDPASNDDPASRGGVVGFLANRRTEPPAPPGIQINPPATRSLKDRRLGTDKAKWGDTPVRQTLEDQDSWYSWRARCIWNAAWDEQVNRWDRTMRRFRGQLAGLIEAFEEHAQAEPGQFAQRTADLYRPRVGVTYLLPPRGDMDAFYRDALARLIEIHHGRRAGTEGDVVHRILGPDGWRHVWETSINLGGAAGVAVARDRLKQEVKRLFLQQDGFESEPLLPTMASLLTATVRRDGPTALGDDDIRQFRNKVHGLVPANFSPQGSGDLKVLISYPAGSKDTRIERYLREEIRLPKETNTVVEFRPINADSIAVVLFRTSMSITEVPELREILAHWAEALKDEQPQDFLKWRQRLGYDYGWLATTEEDRIRILHHVLCAMWNDRITVIDGVIASPDTIRVSLGTADAAAMTLELTPFEPASSWGSVLRAYEDWTLAGDDRIRGEFCEQLMRTQPDGVTGRLRNPGVVMQAFAETAGKQARLLQEMLAKLPPGAQGWASQQYDFWATTVPAALDMPFENVATPVRANLRQLLDMVETRNPEA